MATFNTETITDPIFRPPSEVDEGTQLPEGVGFTPVGVPPGGFPLQQQPLTPELEAAINAAAGQFLNIDPATGQPRGISFEAMTPEQQADLIASQQALGTQLGGLSEQLTGISGQLGEDITGIGGISEQLGGQLEQLQGLGTQQAGIADLLGQRAASLQPIAEQQLAFGTGQTTDPRFELLRRRQLQSQGEFLRRRGLSGSSAAANQLARTEEGIALQELAAQNQALQLGAALTGQQTGILGQQLGAIGQQAGITGMGTGILGQKAGLIGRQAGLRQLQTGIAGQQAGLTGLQGNLLQQQLATQLAGTEGRNLAEQLRLGTITAGIETLSLPEQLRIARLAAANAGQGGGKSDGGGGGLPGQDVINDIIEAAGGDPTDPQTRQRFIDLLTGMPGVGTAVDVATGETSITDPFRFTGFS
jgi:hypothetical protein